MLGARDEAAEFDEMDSATPAEMFNDDPRLEIKHKLKKVLFSFISRIERKYCLISTSYLAGLLNIFMLLHILQNCVYFGDVLLMKALCDALAQGIQFNLISVQSWTYLNFLNSHNLNILLLSFKV